MQQDTKGTLKLTESSDLTVAHCIWPGLPAATYADAPAFWQASSVFLANQANWATLRLANQKTLSNFVALRPSDTVPEYLALTDGDITSPGWAGVTTPARPVLLLVHHVFKMCELQCDGHKPDVCIKKAAPQMNSNMNHINLRQDSTMPAASNTNAHLKCLRAALLMLKVLQLLGSIKIKEMRLHHATASLCRATLSACGEALERLNGTSGYSMQSTQLTAAEHRESQTMSVLLVQMALPIMKQLLKRKILGPRYLHGWNCQLLKSLLPRDSLSTVKAVTSEIMSSGASPLLVCWWRWLLSCCCCPAYRQRTAYACWFGCIPVHLFGQSWSGMLTTPQQTAGVGLSMVGQDIEGLVSAQPRSQCFTTFELRCLTPCPSSCQTALWCIWAAVHHLVLVLMCAYMSAVYQGCMACSGTCRFHQQGENYRYFTIFTQSNLDG